MRIHNKVFSGVIVWCAMLAVVFAGIGGAEPRAAANSGAAETDSASVAAWQSVIGNHQGSTDKTTSSPQSRRAPILGADAVWADGPHILMEAWQNKGMGDAFYDILQRAGVRTLRMSFHGMYSHRSEADSAKIKAENKMTNQYPWFPFGDYANYIAGRDLTTVVGINVEEGPDSAADAIDTFIRSAGQAKLIAVELSNEPWLNYRPWQPEEYAARAAQVIERLTPMGVKFALPLTVGDSRNTPTKLSDTEWNTRMMRALSSRIDLKNRRDIYGVLHLYAGGVRAKSVEFFNRIVRPFAPNMRYLVTEFNIRLNLEGNPHLTNKYGLEFARKLAELMNQPDIEAMYVHGVPYHSIMYWSNRRGVSTVIGGRDEKLPPQLTSQGWHLTPAGKVYALYSKLAWNGDVLSYKEDGKQRLWAVKSPGGALVISVLNEKNQPVTKRLNLAGKSLTVSLPGQSVVCFDETGKEIDQVLLPF
jgi:hypothetical protein